MEMKYLSRHNQGRSYHVKDDDEDADLRRQHVEVITGHSLKYLQLVCKAWVKPARTALKNITVRGPALLPIGLGGIACWKGDPCCHPDCNCRVSLRALALVFGKGLRIDGVESLLPKATHPPTPALLSVVQPCRKSGTSILVITGDRF